MRRRVLGLAVQRRIAGLNPETDHEEIARLSLQVLYGDVMPDSCIRAAFVALSYTCERHVETNW